LAKIFNFTGNRNRSTATMRRLLKIIATFWQQTWFGVVHRSPHKKCFFRRKRPAVYALNVKRQRVAKYAAATDLKPEVIETVDRVAASAYSRHLLCSLRWVTWPSR